MTTYHISPNFSCKYCHGTGTVYDYVPYGSTSVPLPSMCDCISEQLPEDFNDYVDEIEIVEERIILRDGPEFEYDDYKDLYE